MTNPEQRAMSASGEMRVHGELTIYRANEVAETLLAAVPTGDSDVMIDAVATRIAALHDGVRRR